MRYLLGGLLLFGAGVAAGWFLARPDQAPPRAEAGRVPEAPAPRPPGTSPAVPEPATAGAEAPATGGGEAAPGPGATAKPPAKNENPMVGMLRQSLPLLRMSAENEARQRAAAFAAELELPPHRAELLAEAFVVEARRQIDLGLVPMLEDREPDTDALALLEEEDGLSRGLARDLRGVLNDHELGRVRESVRRERERQREERLEARVKELALPGLTGDQERRLRETLRAEDEDDGSPGWSDVRKDLETSLDRDAMLAQMDAKHGRRRERFAAFLTPEQLRHVDAHHEREREEAKLAFEMFGGFLGGGGEVGVTITSEGKK